MSYLIFRIHRKAVITVSKLFCLKFVLFILFYLVPFKSVQSPHFEAIPVKAGLRIGNFIVNGDREVAHGRDNVGFNT